MKSEKDKNEENLYTGWVCEWAHVHF